MATQYYTFSLDSFVILNTRARHLDTDYVAISLGIPGQTPMTSTRAMGDLNNGTYATGLAFPNVAVDDDQTIVFQYLIVNNGHSDPTAVENTLEKIAEGLAVAAAQAAAKAIGTAIGAALGASIGTAVVPIIGSALGALAGWVVNEAEGLIFANCDGPVAAGVHVFTGAQLRAATHSGKIIETTDNNPGTDSPAGCGSNSDYDVTFKVSRSAVARNLRLAAIMVPANEDYQWWWDLTGDEVGQKLQTSRMQLRNISAYVDLDDTAKFVAVMGPPTGEPWSWYWGQTADDISRLLQQNNARLTDICPYGAPDGSLRFAVIMVGVAGQTWWWYWGQTADDISRLLQQNNATLTKISPYWDHGSLRFAIIMRPNAGQRSWWYWGQTGQDVGANLGENHAELTDIAAYVDHSDNVRFAVLMGSPLAAPWSLPGGTPSWWYWGQTGDDVGRLLQQNKARPTVLTPYFS